MKFSTTDQINIFKAMTWEQYVASDYPQKECEHFGWVHLMTKELKRWSKYSPQVFITKQNPEHNYGLDFKVYLRYKADGINFFKELSYGSASLTNAGFRAISSLSFFQTEEQWNEMTKALPYPTNVRWSSAMLSEHAYENNEETREFFRKNDHMTATTEF